jgi:hypothetical protein
LTFFEHFWESAVAVTQLLSLCDKLTTFDGLFGDVCDWWQAYFDETYFFGVEGRLVKFN